MTSEDKGSHAFRNVLVGIILGALICGGGVFAYWQLQSTHNVFGGETAIDLQVLKESMKKEQRAPDREIPLYSRKGDNQPEHT